MPVLLYHRLLPQVDPRWPRSSRLKPVHPPCALPLSPCGATAFSRTCPSCPRCGQAPATACPPLRRQVLMLLRYKVLRCRTRLWPKRLRPHKRRPIPRHQLYLRYPLFCHQMHTTRLLSRRHRHPLPRPSLKPSLRRSLWPSRHPALHLVVSWLLLEPTPTLSCSTVLLLPRLPLPARRDTLPRRTNPCHQMLPVPRVATRLHRLLACLLLDTLPPRHHLSLLISRGPPAL